MAVMSPKRFESQTNKTAVRPSGRQMPKEFAMTLVKTFTLRFNPEHMQFDDFAKVDLRSAVTRLSLSRKVRIHEYSNRLYPSEILAL